ncbi:toll/interleukin-1 receptor domain-containing protein [Piscinibacter sakaiensis]|uniref:toll/interleukin-1 receptor domain-containing protein n=1 Tax=Piscinibacter sakaiensis TaxID=1547922 RepID=UPI003AACB485
MPNAPSRIFFSYSRSDSNFVLKVARALRSEGRDVWVDQLDIPKGARWDVEVEKALKASGCLLVVLSPASTNSQNVLDEVSYALEERRKVLPILLQPTNIPFRLKRLQYIDFTGDFDAAYRQLVAALDHVPVSGSMIKPLPAAQPEASDPAAAPPVQAGPAAPPVAMPLPPPPPAAADAVNARPRSLAAIVVLLMLLLLLLLGGAWWLYMKAAPTTPVRPAERPDVVGAAQPTPTAAPVPAPQPPTIADAQLTAFVDAYIRAQNQASAAELLDFYGERIDYFDHAGVGREFVQKDKQSFYSRWPQVEYRRSGDLNIDRLPDEPAARVSYLVDYRVHSPARSQSRSGRALDYLMLRFDDGRIRIVAQRQDIVQSGGGTKN